MIKYLLKMSEAPTVEMSRLLNILRRVDHVEHDHDAVTRPLSRTLNFFRFGSHSLSFHNIVLERSEVLTALLLKMQVFWVLRRGVW